MQYRQLGRSGLRVSVLSMGTMTFGGSGTVRKGRQTSISRPPAARSINASKPA